MSYKILSLDGGGAWALIQARILQDLYGDLHGQEILREFDMAIANSGGSMVLAAMVSNLKMSEIISVFTNEADRKEVFSKLSLWENVGMKILRIFNVGAKYSAARKLTGLENILMKYTNTKDKNDLLVNQPMSKIPSIVGGKFPDLIICGYNYFTERASFFRSNLLSKTDDFRNVKYDISMLHAIHASSNAPLNYFDAPAIIKTGVVNTQLKTHAWYWDGAVGGFNNPIMAGLVEAMTNTNKNTGSDYRILSVGTAVGRKPIIVGYDEGTQEQQLIYQANKKNRLVLAQEEFGFKNDLSKMAQSILADPPDAASFVAFSVLKPDLENNSCIVRINPCINPVLNSANNKYEVPTAWGKGEDSFITLLEMDMDAVAQDEVNLIVELCDKFIVEDENKDAISNQFIRGDSNSKKHIGYGSYALAKKNWKK
jgi:uncharacterized protein